MRSLREIAVLAGLAPHPRHEPAAATPVPVSPASGAPAPKPAAASRPPGSAAQGALETLIAPPGGGFHLARHAVNTALLAARIVTALGQNDDAPATAMLALLHDAGLLEAGVDPLAEHAGVESEASLDPRGLRLRPAASLKALGVDDPEMASRIADVHAALAAAAPSGERSRIDLRSQAVALAALIDRTWQAARERVSDLHDVTSLVMAEHGQHFSPLLFRALLRAVPIFPIGCVVELSSGDLARVVSQNEENHFRPRVEITPGAGRSAGGERRVVDLARAPFLHIRHRVAAGGARPAQARP